MWRVARKKRGRQTEAATVTLSVLKVKSGRAASASFSRGDPAGRLDAARRGQNGRVEFNIWLGQTRGLN